MRTSRIGHIEYLRGLKLYLRKEIKSYSRRNITETCVPLCFLLWIEI